MELPSSCRTYSRDTPEANDMSCVQRGDSMTKRCVRCFVTMEDDCELLQGCN